MSWFTKWGRRGATSSGQVAAASAVIKASAGCLSAVLIKTDGTNAVTIMIYDNPSAASGTVLFSALVPGATGFGYFPFPIPLLFATGAFLTLSGTGGRAYVNYS